MGLYYYDWVFGEVITAARLNAPWTAAGHLDLDFATSAKNAGTAATPLLAIYLDNTATDGGSIYFDAGITEYIKSNAAGTTLAFGGFTTIDFEAATTIDFNASTFTGISDLGTITTCDINSGTLSGITIDGNWTAVGQTCADLGTVTTADINAGTWQGTIDGNWTAAGQTCADLGIVTTVDINSGSIDGAAIGAATPSTGAFTTLYVSGLFTVGVAANPADFPNAYSIIAQNSTGDTSTSIIGLVAEAISTVENAIGLYGTVRGNGTGTAIGVCGRAIANNVAGDVCGGLFYTTISLTGANHYGIKATAGYVGGLGEESIGVWGQGRSCTGRGIGAGVYGNCYVSDALYTDNAYGVYGNSDDAHAGANIAVYGNAVNGLTNYSFYGAAGQIFNTDELLIGTNASVVDFPSTQAIISQDDSGAADAALIALAIEANATAITNCKTIYSVAKTFGAQAAYAMQGIGIVNAAGDTGSAVGLYGSATAVHGGGNNVGVLGNAANGVNNYSFYGAAGQIFNTDEVLIGTDASVVDFPATKMIVSQADSGKAVAENTGITAEAVADAVNQGVGIRGIGVCKGAETGIGVVGYGLVDATGDTAFAVGGDFLATDAHAGGNNIAVYGDAVNAGGGGAYCFYGNNGQMFVTLAGIPAAANNAAAAAVVAVGGFYRTNADPSVLCIRSA